MYHGALEFTRVISSRTLQANKENFKRLFRNHCTSVSKNKATVGSSTSSENLDYSAKEVALSFQIMTCAEPPELVIETINSLLAIKSAQDEILIIDNNNKQKHLYQPLADYCNQLSPELKVHFYHVDKIKGYKAGALNLALELMDANSTHIVVVDSDYQALPQARSSIARAISLYPQHSLLQFPQFYRNSGQDEVHNELNHYFNHHLFRSFNCNKALSTGTYAVIKRSDLIRLGGWSSDSITEDAQMGVNMHRSGLYTKFIPEVISNGLLPNTFKDLISQRQRWIYGNMQVLTGYLKSTPTSKTNAIAHRKQTVADKLGYIRAHLSQLTAWVNFTGPVILLHIVSLLIIATSVIFPTVIALDSSTVQLMLMSVYCGYGLFVLRRLWAYLQDKTPLNNQLDSQTKFGLNARLRTWLMHLNFWELGAISWLPVLWGQDKPFTCTPKQKLLDSDTHVFIKNLRVAPKLLILLNLITAVMVSPLTAFYSAPLFMAAISFLALKIGALIVATNNFTEVEAESKNLTDQSIEQFQHYINKVTDNYTETRSANLATKDKLKPLIRTNRTKSPNKMKAESTNSKLDDLIAANHDNFVSTSDSERVEHNIK